MNVSPLNDDTHGGLDDRFPKDAFMLASVINTKLRDDYSGIDELCDDLGIDRSALEKKLSDAGFEYLPDINQFR